MDELYSNEPQVTEADKQELRAAILHAYPDLDFLYLRLGDKWGAEGFDIRQYFDVNNRGFIPIVKDVVEYASGEGRVLDLLAVTWTDKPNNPRFKALAERLFTDKQAVLDKYAAQPPLPPSADPAIAGPNLEKLVEKRSRLLNLVKFTQGLEQLSRALCRISLKSAAAFEPKGTGFLVGRRTVLTNYHVMQEAIEGQFGGDRILLEFDFDGDAANAHALAVATDRTWESSHRHYSQSDLTGVGQPGPDELDFALLTLAAEVPADRPQLVWPLAPPIVSQRDFVVIGQHPQGDAANIAFGEVLAYPGAGLRYRYDVTTDGGSSGSPVLTLDQKLVALHHAADPQYRPQYNQGVPIWLIKSAIEADGIKMAAL